MAGAIDSVPFHPLHGVAHKGRRYVGRVVIGQFVFIAVLPWSCREESATPPAPAGASAEAAPKKQSDILTFPDELRVEDNSVNDFVTHAMTVCGAGEYEPFRLLWSVREEPLPKDQFEEGWQAVELIRLKAVRKAKLLIEIEGAAPDGETVYVVLAEVRFDPQQPAGKRHATREVIVMLVRENDQWRVAQAPTKMREWIREQAADGGGSKPPRTPQPAPHETRQKP